MPSSFDINVHALGHVAQLGQRLDQFIVAVVGRHGHERDI